KRTRSAAPAIDLQPVASRAGGREASLAASLLCDEPAVAVEAEEAPRHGAARVESNHGVVNDRVAGACPAVSRLRPEADCGGPGAGAVTQVGAPALQRRVDPLTVTQQVPAQRRGEKEVRLNEPEALRVARDPQVAFRPYAEPAMRVHRSNGRYPTA